MSVLDDLSLAVASGDLGLAGSLLACGAVSNPSSEGGGQSGRAEALCPVCYDAVPPLDSVGCLGGGSAGAQGGGHGLHAACASDLLLGGGACPECREPLFFAKVCGQWLYTSKGEACDKR